MLLNFTNHPYAQWGGAQRRAAAQYGAVRDFPFPNVPPALDEAGLDRMADQYAEALLNAHPSAVLCQGEAALAFRIICRLQQHGIPVLAASTERISHERPLPDGSAERRAVFVFCRFRRYDSP